MKCQHSNPIQEQFNELPFGRTHIQFFKQTVESINAEKFTVEQMAKKFQEVSHLSEWNSNGVWDEDSNLSILLKNYMPDSSNDGLLSYTGVMSLGLLLCTGSTYEKAKILFQLVESANGNTQ